MANGAVQHNLPFSFTVSVSHTYRSRLHQIHQWQQCMVQSTQQPQTSLDSEAFAHSSLFSQHSLTSLRGSYVQHCQLYYLHANDCSGVTVTYCHRERSAFRTFSTALIRSWNSFDTLWLPPAHLSSPVSFFFLLLSLFHLLPHKRHKVSKVLICIFLIVCRPLVSTFSKFFSTLIQVKMSHVLAVRTTYEHQPLRRCSQHVTNGKIGCCEFRRKVMWKVNTVPGIDCSNTPRER